MTDEVWQQLNLPQLELSDLDRNAPTYVDAYLAVEVFGMRYPDYVALVPRTERLFYQILLALKGAKEKRAMERAQAGADAERAANAGLSPHDMRM